MQAADKLSVPYPNQAGITLTYVPNVLLQSKRHTDESHRKNPTISANYPRLFTVLCTCFRARISTLKKTKRK